MKNLLIKLSSVVALLSVSATAFAKWDDTAYFKIGRLDALRHSSDGYRVYPGGGYALPTSQGCKYNDFAVLDWEADASVSEKVMMNNTLLAAFMAGRRVKLRLDGCHATDKRPKYRIVTLEYTQ